MTTRRGQMSALLGVVAAGLCVPAAVGVVLLTTKASAATARDAARHDALHAAARIARDVLSYDYRTIDGDIARARSDTTGVFAREYASAAAQLRSEAVVAHAIVQARVRDAGIISAGTSHVVVLVFADQVSVTRAAGSAIPTTRLIPSTVQMTLTQVGGRWRVASLTALQAGATGSTAG